MVVRWERLCVTVGCPPGGDWEYVLWVPNRRVWIAA
jgi:hypothetical protein